MKEPQSMLVQIKPGRVVANGHAVELEPTPDLTLHPGVNTGTIEIRTFFGPVTGNYHVNVPLD